MKFNYVLIKSQPAKIEVSRFFSSYDLFPDSENEGSDYLLLTI
jgi:hypothetical protein